MTKTIVAFSILFFLFAGRLSAQTPAHINYQAALRNTETGVELSNQQVYMVVKFLNGGPGGDIVYQEEHDNVSTTLYGIINIQLGNGDPVQGNFNSIPWASGDIWLDLEVDAGKGLQSIGTTKFSSVPYALYAADAPQSEPDGDGDSTNEIQSLLFSDNVLSISHNDNATPIDLSGFVNVPDADSDPTNEIQNLMLTQNTLSITGNPDANNIDLSPYVNVPDADSDPTNELITAFDYNPVTAIISITEGGITRTQDLSTLVDGGEPDADSDPTNEIQDLSLSGNNLTITGNPGATEIDLSIYENIPNLDNDPLNEIQDLNLTGTILKITGNASATNIDLSPYVNEPNLDNDPENEIQDLSLTGNTLKITGNPSATNINLSPYVNVPNLDNDPENEIQDLNLTGTILKITGNASATNIDLSGFTNIPNLDNSPTNEIQDLSFSGNVLSITGNASATNINLSQYQNPALPQGQIFVGNASNVATPQPVTGDISLSDDGDFNVTGLRDIPISTTAPTDGQVLRYNSGNNTWEPVDGTYIAATAMYYSVDPMDFVEIHDPNGDADMNSHNSLKFFNEDAPFAMLRNGNIRTIGAPVHLPHGAVINQIKFFIKDAAPGWMQFSLIRKQISNFSTSNTTLAGGTSILVTGNSEETLSVSTNNVVNNQLYTYRVMITFSNVYNNDDQTNPNNVPQVVYGAVVRYTN